jgi:ComF family protein
MGIPFINALLSDLVQLFVPKLCGSCAHRLHSFEDAWCLQCIAGLPFSSAMEQQHRFELAQKLSVRMPIRSAESLFVFESGSPVQDILHAVKYQNAQPLAFRLGQLLGRQLQAGVTHLPDVLVPVPLHPKKKKIRGYNQSELLARGISSATGISVDAELLIRNRHTPTQTGMDRTERWQNTSGAFECSKPIKAGVHIALVDDMITTGATLEACYRAMEIPEVSVMGLAYARDT